MHGGIDPPYAAAGSRATIGWTVAADGAAFGAPRDAVASGSAAVEPLAADVTLEVVTTVPDARVFVEGQAVGAAPGRYRLPRGEAPVRIEVRAPGYESASIVVAPSADVSFEPKLVRAPGRGPAATLPAAPKPSTAPTAAATLDPDLAEPSY